MKIWVDLVNAPQVLFMQPIIAELRKRDHEVLITTRDFTETINLANRYCPDHVIVGAHGGKTMIGKVIANLHRAAKLARLIVLRHISLALSHGSISQAITSTMLSIPTVAIGDYEGQPGNHFVCRVIKKLIVPDVLCKTHLHRYGLTDTKVASYPGIKEQVYLASFSPDPAFRDWLGFSDNRIIVAMRPPSEVSAYHRFRNTVFDETLRYVAGNPNTFVVLLPRGVEQRDEYTRFDLKNVFIPQEVIDGPQLVYWSDLVIGAGGTMNREATVLGTPVYTQFQGLAGSVDQHLIKQGKMVRVIDPDDIPSIKICKKQPAENEPWKQGKGLASIIVDKILS